MNNTRSMLPIRFLAALWFVAGGLAAHAREPADGAVLKHILDGCRAGLKIIAGWRANTGRGRFLSVLEITPDLLQ